MSGDKTRRRIKDPHSVYAGDGMLQNGVFFKETSPTFKVIHGIIFYSEAVWSGERYRTSAPGRRRIWDSEAGCLFSAVLLWTGRYDVF